MIGPSKRVNYRDLVRRVYWRRVDSGFEADLAYYEAARQIFPESYRGMVGLRPAWFLHVDPTAQFPRYTKTQDIADCRLPITHREQTGMSVLPAIGKRKSERYLGPVQDKHRRPALD